VAFDSQPTLRGERVELRLLRGHVQERHSVGACGRRPDSRTMISPMLSIHRRAQSAAACRPSEFGRNSPDPIQITLSLVYNSMSVGDLRRVATWS